MDIICHYFFHSPKVKKKSTIDTTAQWKTKLYICYVLYNYSVLIVEIFITDLNRRCR